MGGRKKSIKVLLFSSWELRRARKKKKSSGRFFFPAISPFLESTRRGQGGGGKARAMISSMRSSAFRVWAGKIGGERRRHPVSLRDDASYYRLGGEVPRGKGRRE